MFKQLSELTQSLKEKNICKKLALAVSQDVYSLGAIDRACREGLITPVFIGAEKETRSIIQKNGFDFTDAAFVNIEDRDAAVAEAIRFVSSGKADILMKGHVSTHDLLVGVLNKEWGLRTGRLLSHFALFEVATYHKLIAITDVAMNIAPDLQDKISIINNSVQYLHKIGVPNPKVAVLGAIEMVNENMQATLDAALLSKMNQREQIKGCVIDGPLAFDNAVSIESAHYKGIKSEVAGDTDLLLMPDIEVGNVLYKSLVIFAKAQVASVVLGAKAPIVLSSRSDSEDSKYYSILLAAFN